MRQISDKKNDSIASDGFLNDYEYNNHKNEIQNVITQSGQAFDETKTDQFGKAIANYAAISDFYTDSGSANNYILTGINQFKSPSAYVQGMRIAFIPSNTNTGTSTVDVVTLGSTPLVDYFGAPFIGGELQAGQIYEFRLESGSFKLLDTADFIPRFKQGLILSNNITNPTTHLDMSTGTTSSTDNTIIMKNSVAGFNKSIGGTWVLGSGNNGLASTITPPITNGYLDIFLLSDQAGNEEMGYDSPGSNGVNLLATPSVISAGFTKAALLGQWATDGSSNLHEMVNYGVYTFYKTTNSLPIQDYLAVGVPLTLTPVTLSVARGRRVEALITYGKINSDQKISDGYSMFPYEFTATPPSPLNDQPKWDFGINMSAGTINNYTVQRFEKMLTDSLARIKYSQNYNIYEPGGGFQILTWGWKDLYWET